MKPAPSMEFEQACRGIFYDFNFCAASDNLLAFFYLGCAPDVYPDRTVKLQGLASGRGLRIAVHHADLHPNLIDEDDDAS